jgi:hypothetical protein
MPEIGISISTPIPSSKIAGYTMTYSITVYNNNPVPVRCRLSYDQDGGVNDIAVSANSSTTFTTSYYNTSLEGRPTYDIVTAYFYYTNSANSTTIKSSSASALIYIT